MTTQIAVIQLTGAPGAPDANRVRSCELINDAAKHGAGIIVLPELVISGYTLDLESLEVAAEPLHGPTVDAWINSARTHDILVAGGFCEREGNDLYNSAVLIGPEGLLLHYRKLHLFDREKLVFTPGDKGLGVAATARGVIGICVCYDLRFMEVMRVLALKGADMVLVPTAWVRGFDRVERDGDGLIGQARGAIVQANLNQVYVACASQCSEAGGMRFLGSSLIADPFGRVLGGPLTESGEEILHAVFDPEIVRQSRERSDLVKPRLDRRTDVYRLYVGKEAF